MECFKTVLKSIGFVIALFGGGAIILGIIATATVATAAIIGVGAGSPWVVVIYIVYIVVGIGTTIGFVECYS